MDYIAKHKPTMQKLTLLLFLAALMLSCEDNKDLDVTLNESGTFKVTALDTADNGMANARVEIVALSSGNVVYYDSTNEKGVCSVNSVNQGNYKCKILAPLGRKEYLTEKNFQIIAGERKSLTLYPMKNAGNATVKVLKHEDSTNIENINVALIPQVRMASEEYHFERVKEKAFFISETDANGEVLFDNVPITGDSPRPLRYSVLVFFDEKDYYYANENFEIIKDNHSQITIYAFIGE